MVEIKWKVDMDLVECHWMMTNEITWPQHYIFLMAREDFFQSCFFFQYFFFFSWQLGLIGWLEQGGAKALPLIYFVFLGLDSLVRGSLTVVCWVCIFEKMMWDKQWPLGQQASKFQTMVLDFRLVLASTLIILCIIFLKLVDAQFCCSISILIEGLRSF